MDDVRPRPEPERQRGQVEGIADTKWGRKKNDDEGFSSSSGTTGQEQLGQQRQWSLRMIESLQRDAQYESECLTST